MNIEYKYMPFPEGNFRAVIENDDCTRIQIKDEKTGEYRAVTHAEAFYYTQEVVKDARRKGLI